MQSEHPGTILYADIHTSGPFYTSETGERKSFYGVSSVPDVFTDGLSPALGASSCTQAHATYLNRYNARMTAVNSESPVSITGYYFILGDSVHVFATFTLVDAATLGTTRGTMFLVEDRVQYNQTTFFDKIARRIVHTPVTLTNQGDAVSISLTFPLNAAWHPENMHCYMVFQKYVSGKDIYQAADLPLGDPASVGTPALAQNIQLQVSPNPMSSDTKVSFDLKAPTAVRLMMVDPAGRCVKTLLSAPMASGVHLARWNGTDDAGQAVPSGVYFARLSSGSASTSTKVILTR